MGLETPSLMILYLFPYKIYHRVCHLHKNMIYYGKMIIPMQILIIEPAKHLNLCG